MNPYDFLRQIDPKDRTVHDYRKAVQMPGGAWASEAYGWPSKLSWVLFLSDGLFNQWLVQQQ